MKNKPEKFIICLCAAALGLAFVCRGQVPTTQAIESAKIAGQAGLDSIYNAALQYADELAQAKIDAEKQATTDQAQIDTLKQQDVASQSAITVLQNKLADTQAKYDALAATTRPVPVTPPANVEAFVSPDGVLPSDIKANGTYKTLQAALVATAGKIGSTIMVRGTLHERPQIGVAHTFIAYAKEVATLDADGQPYTLTGPPNCVLERIAVKNVVFAKDRPDDSAASIKTQRDSAKQHFAIHTNAGWKCTDISGQSDSGGIQFDGAGNVALRPTANYCGQEGISYHSCSGTIDSPTATFNNTAGAFNPKHVQYSIGDEAGGGKASGCNLPGQTLTILNPNYSDNGGIGLWFDYKNERISVLGGNCSRNHFGTKTGQTPGVVVEISNGPILIQGVTVQDNDNGHIGMAAWESGRVAGGGVTFNKNIVRGQIGGRTYHKGAAEREPGLGNISITNNDITGTIYGADDIKSPADLKSRNIVSDGNIYHPGPDGTVGYFFGGKQTLAQMQAIGLEQHGRVSQP